MKDQRHRFPVKAPSRQLPNNDGLAKPVDAIQIQRTMETVQSVARVAATVSLYFSFLSVGIFAGLLRLFSYHSEAIFVHIRTNESSGIRADVVALWVYLATWLLFNKLSHCV